MTNNETKTCIFCSAPFTPKIPGAQLCGATCSARYHAAVSTGSDDGYDAWRDSQYDRYDPRDWRWGSWDK